MSEKTLVLRVKRKKLTVFVTAEPTDTVLEVKETLHDLLSQPPEAQRLFRDAELLDDSKTLAELRVENDSVLALTYQIKDSTEWEVVDITALDVAKEGGRAYYE